MAEINSWFEDDKNSKSIADRCKNCGVKYEHGEKMCFCPEGKLYPFQSKIMDMIEEGSFSRVRKYNKYF